MQILTALLVVALCPSDAHRISFDHEAKLLQDCWKKETITLERSGESPGDIATAAIKRCDVNIVRTSDASDRCAGKPLELRTMLESRIRDAVIADVVTIRSKKR